MSAPKADNCPWCDADAPDWLMLPGHTTACMACTVCGARGPAVAFELRKEAVNLAVLPALIAWNSRAALQNGGE